MDFSVCTNFFTNIKYFLIWILKTFFSEGIETDSGGAVSNTQVKSRLKEIIETEDKHNPISDEELTDMINGEGYKIARRTITKYREQWKFPTARLRRKL